MTWFDDAKKLHTYMVRLDERFSVEQVVDSLTQEFDAIREFRDKLRSLEPEQRKRVWFYMDQLMRDGLGD